MTSVNLRYPNRFEEWRSAARRALTAQIAPDDLHWHAPGLTTSLFAQEPIAANLFPACPSESDSGTLQKPAFTMPRRFAEQAQRAICHRDPTRFARLYQLIWRLQEQKRLLENEADDDVCWLNARARSVGRDIHKMRAFVRFRKVETSDGDWFVAWFEPDHLILEQTADFFAKRFAGMRFSILTPDSTMHWDTHQTRFGPGCQRDQAPADDALEAHWKRYYASIFNPARLKINVMTSEMPRKYWKNMAETQLIPGLIASAQSRAEQMRALPASVPNTTAAVIARRAGVQKSCPSEKPQLTLEAIAGQLQHCERCTLANCASQSVPGTGPSDARLMIIGEQPGDEEDLAGKPFVGPAGQLLDHTLGEFNIDRQRLYLTNAVKHFKYRVRGKRRLHQRASNDEVEQCRWWLAQELEALAPTTILALGRTASTALLRQRKVPLEQTGPVATLGDATVFVTYHPAYLLRLPDGVTRTTAGHRFSQTIHAAWAHSQAGGMGSGS